MDGPEPSGCHQEGHGRPSRSVLQRPVLDASGQSQGVRDPLADQFPEWRRELGERLGEVRQALTYLDECKSARTFTRDSYGLKHRAENLHLIGGYWPRHHVSNGSMIAACLIRGIRFRLIDAGPNCELAL